MLQSRRAPHRESPSENPFYTRQAKLLLLDDVTCGACKQTRGQLVLNSDGTGTWTCSTTSCNCTNGEVWHTDFALKDANGSVLFGLGPFYSPLIRAGQSASEASWSTSFTFSVELFSDIHSAVQHCGCLPPVHALRQATPVHMVTDRVRCRTDLRSFIGGAYA